MRVRWAELFGVDLRSLALFRGALGALLLVDLARRAADFTAFYTEAGVLPLEALGLLSPRAASFSLHVWVGSSPLAVAALFALAAAAALALALGWHTRSATVLSWYLLASVQARNPWLGAMGGDALLRLLLFWSVFLPLGARWSLDAARDPRLRAAPVLHVSAASVALLGQVCLLYFATGAQKSGALWDDGTAVRYALELEPFVTGVGVWLRDRVAWLLPLATHGVRWFERLGPLLAFSPVATGPLRTLAVALFFAFHLALAAGLDIGLFPAASLVAWLAFLPAWFWDELLRRPEPAPAAGTAPVRLAPPWPVQVAVAGLFAWVAIFVTAVGFGAGNPFPAPLRAVGSALRLSQHWQMFSPDPPLLDSWIERIGTTRNGERIDVARRGPAAAEKPERLSALESWSWRIWLGHLVALPLDHPARAPILDRLAAFSCREGGFEAIEIVQVGERTLPVGSAPIERTRMLERACAREEDA